MLRRVIRAVATLLVFIVVGILVVSLVGGSFWVGGGLASCPASVDQGSGPVPDVVQGGYEVSFVVQAGDFMFRPAATLRVEPDTVRISAEGCDGTRRPINRDT
jgi:hypothetical protein